MMEQVRISVSCGWRALFWNLTKVPNLPCSGGKGQCAVPVSDGDLSRPVSGFWNSFLNTPSGRAIHALKVIAI